jgi:hypothetical protein
MRRNIKPQVLSPTKSTIALAETLGALESVSLGYYSLGRQRGLSHLNKMPPTFHKKARGSESEPWFMKANKPRMRQANEVAILREFAQNGVLQQKEEEAKQAMAVSNRQKMRYRPNSAHLPRTQVLPLIADQPLAAPSVLPPSPITDAHAGNSLHVNGSNG